MKALDRKLVRDLRLMRTQAIAIALVVAAGVALFLAAVTTARSLRLSEARYYEDQRFAHVWGTLAQAPESVVRDIASIPGVAAVEGRIVVQAILDVQGIEEPVTGLLVSIPPEAGHALNDLYVRRGRHVEPGRPGEVLVSEAFAEKNAIRIGASVPAVVAGHRVDLKIVGIALSPEFVMQAPPGSLMPDDRRFGVFWMVRDELAALSDLRGAVNNVAVRLSAAASEVDVIRQIDRVLDPYGGRGANGRTSQFSHLQLEEHIRQLEALSLLVPSIFLVVSAFLVNVVLSRLVGVQRAQIGMLKAFGYSNGRLAGHYLSLTLAIVAGGALIALPFGAWLGRLMTEFYGTFFRFPILVFRVEPGVVLIGVSVTTVASAAGALGALRSVAAMPPIVAMSPPAPDYRRTWLDRIGILASVGPVTRMIARNVSRRPLRAALTAAGMAGAVAVLVLGGSSVDAIDRIVAVQFHGAQREDLSVTLAHDRSLPFVHTFEALPGVRIAEPYRAVPARVHVAARAQDVMLFGLATGSRLRRIVDVGFREAPPPPDGALVGAWLSTQLGIHRSDDLAVEIRTGRRRIVTIRVVGIVDEPLGASLYMDLSALGRLLSEPDRFSGVNLLVDPIRRPQLYTMLKQAPEAQAVQVRRGSLANFQSMSDKSLQFIRRIMVVFSIIIAFGVVYNSARIALAERGYELATLRVLGFTRAEISAVLLGETGLLALPAVPLGMAVGFALSAWVTTAMSSERFRMPMVIEPPTYAFAILVFAAASCVSALLVRRRLDRLDLVGVLKARE